MAPASRRVRQRLTELGIDYITRQVPVEKDDRVLLRERTGTDTIPVLVVPAQAPVVGEESDPRATSTATNPIPRKRAPTD